MYFEAINAIATTTQKYFDQTNYKPESSAFEGDQQREQLIGNKFEAEKQKYIRITLTLIL